MSLMVHWCELCNSRPANGTLEVIYEGETEITFVQACTLCVVDLEEDDWIDNIDHKGKRT